MGLSGLSGEPLGISIQEGGGTLASKADDRRTGRRVAGQVRSGRAGCHESQGVPWRGWLMVNIFGMPLVAQDAVDVEVAEFDEDLAGEPEPGAGDFFGDADDLAGVIGIALLADALGLDAGTDGEEAF